MKHLRKRTFVDKVVQGGIVARLLGYWLATIVACLALGTLLSYFGNPFLPLSEHVLSQLHTQAPFILAALLVVPICILHLIRFTHRFAGPVVRLRNRLEELAAGNLGDELRFRDGDYWQDLASAFNRVRAVQAGDVATSTALPAMDVPFASEVARQGAAEHV